MAVLAGMCVSFHQFLSPPKLGTAPQTYGPIEGSDEQTNAATFSPIASGPLTVARFYGVVDSWVSHGVTPPDPSSSASARAFIPAKTIVDMIIPAGHKAAWAPDA